MIYVLPLHEKPVGTVFNVTSKGNKYKVLSPFYLGPIRLYDNYISQNVENAWQFSKVYAQHVKDGEPTEEYFKWAEKGWGSKYAYRYPMGKGAIPEYSYWNGDKLGYIDARKLIYSVLYATSVIHYQWDLLKEILEESKRSDITIQDYDAYNHHELGMSLRDVAHCENRKMGHGFVLAKILEGME